MRAISEHLGEPVDLLIAGEFASMLPLLSHQPYLGVVTPDSAWSMSHDWQPPKEGMEAILDIRNGGYDRIYHLGYRRWPELPLPFEVQETARREYGFEEQVNLDLKRPWITVSQGLAQYPLVIGFTDCWFELKYGLVQLLDQPVFRMGYWPCCAPGSRWVTEGGGEPCGWMEAAMGIMGCHVFLGDCSALHVLAVAMGKPVVIVEPMEARWNGIFYPLGMAGPQVTVVHGTDGRPTFDARHCADTLRTVLAGAHV